MIPFDASDITRWADTPDAHHQLPQLIRRLVMATVPMPSLVDMPSGSSVPLPGWDGLLTVENGNAWVPSGDSAWEFSSQKQGIAGKANADYNKRLTDPLGVNARDTTFVFATPRRWSGKRDWINARKNDGQWADVRALDAENLVQWLDIAPSVALWFARLIGNLPHSGFLCLDEWWDNWSSITKPALTPELVTAGRDEQVSKVSDWISGDASAYYLQADTTTEAIAFLAASAKTMAGPQGDALMARAVVAETADAWRQLAGHSTPLVLVRGFSEGGVSSHIAIKNGHHVLVPLDLRDDPGDDRRNNLPRLGWDETVYALTRMGLSEPRAKALTRISAGSLMVMCRQLANEPGVLRPKWTSLPITHPISTLSLISQWEGNHDGDKAIVAEITGQPYERVERAITELATMPDAPISKTGNRWRFISSEEAWHLLAPKLTSSDIKRFGEIASKALGAISPRFDLPSEEQFMASVKGKVLDHSDTLRAGIVRSLALMGARPERAGAANADDARYTTSNVVSEALGGNNGWRIWATLGNNLAALAEAAPAQFLEAVERDLAANPSPFSDLFAQEGDVLFVGCHHAGLLWALEGLAWSPDHFSRVARALACLTEMDPGGQAANRPASSLKSLFLPSIRFSEVSDEYRVETLEGILSAIPNAGWRLLVDAHPNSHDFIMLRNPPAQRPWAQDGVPKPTWKEFYAFAGEIERLLMENVGGSAARWADMVEIIPRLSQENRENALESLSQRISALREDAQSEKLWRKLRECLSHHRSFPDADWAMSASDLDALDAVYRQLTPSDPSVAYSWLFAFRPKLPEGSPRHHIEYQKAIDDARNTAVRTAFSEGGMSAILEMARGAEIPDILGFFLPDAVDSADTLEVALQHLESPEPNLVMLARGALAGLYSKLGWDILDQALGKVKDSGANPESLAYIYLAAPAVPETWRRLECEDRAVQVTYWLHLPPFKVAETDGEFAARKLLSVRRFSGAIALRSFSSVPCEIIIEALEGLPHELPNPATGENPRPDAYEIVELLERLDQSDKVSDEIIASLEIPYFEILRQCQDRPNMAIYRMVCKYPSVFADLISWVFKPDNSSGDDEVLDEQAERRADFGFRVFWGLDQIPGLMDDGSVDAEILTAWVKEARRLCRERDREAIGDQQIGQILANAPAGVDGVWPCEAVRDALDGLASHEVGIGFVIGKRNLRGVTARGVFDGGDQERVLAANYRRDAAKISARWSFTASRLREIADGYEADARWNDDEADWRDRSETL